MRTKDRLDGQNRPTFTELARRAQIIECATETLATLGYAQTSLAQIAKQAGVSKGVIIYYFNSKEELFEEVVKSMVAEATAFMGPQVAAQTTSSSRLRAYIGSNILYIAAHRAQMMAIIEIALNMRTEDGKLRYHLGKEEQALAALEGILRQGQTDGEFRDFDLRVMAITIRGAIDAAAPLFLANPSLGGETYARELVALFEHATRKL